MRKKKKKKNYKKDFLNLYLWFQDGNGKIDYDEFVNMMKQY